MAQDVSPPTGDPAAEYWNAAHRSYFVAAYNALLTEKVVDRWKRCDDSARVIVALTASGSALAGWTLWDEPSYRGWWAALAGLGALLSIVSTSLNVSGRLKDWESARQRFSMLQQSHLALITRLKVKWTALDQPEELRDIASRFEELEKESAGAAQEIRPDLLKTKSLERWCDASTEQHMREYGMTS